MDLNLNEPHYRLHFSADRVRLQALAGLVDLLPANPGVCLPAATTPAQLAEATRCLNALAQAYHRFNGSVAAMVGSGNVAGAAILPAMPPAPFEALWADEDAVLTASERCVADEVAIDEVPELDLAVIDVPEGAPAAGGHRFGGRWSAGLHPMALNNVTERTALLIRRGRHHELVYRYETWVQMRSRPVRPRVDLAPLAAHLGEIETGGATWTAASPSGLLAGLAIDGDAESTIDPDRLRSLVEDHLATAPVAWEPFVGA